MDAIPLTHTACAPLVEGMMTVCIILGGEACACLTTNHELKELWALWPEMGEEGLVLCSTTPTITNKET